MATKAPEGQTWDSAVASALTEVNQALRAQRGERMPYQGCAMVGYHWWMGVALRAE